MLEISLIKEYRLTDHAKFEMERRQITEKDIELVLSIPGQVEMVGTGRVVYQSRFEFGEPPKSYLLRVFVDIDRKPPEVVTAYRTRKIEKYWRKKV